MLRITVLSIALFLASTSTAFAQGAGCNERANPHSFGCQQAAFEGRTQFPLIEIDFAQARGSWFATTFATPFGNAGDGFMMDLDPRNPRRPGNGVLVVPGAMMPATIMGNLHFFGSTASFDNWQNQRMDSTRGTLRSIDSGTIEFQSVDRWGFTHNFQCRDFLRGEVEHLQCKWFILENGPRGARWLVKGYFGFLRTEDWDQFVQTRR